MPSSRRRASARVAVALVVTAAISLAAAVAAQAATNPVSITVNVGYSGFVKPQQWIPVTVDVTNRGPAVDGTLEVTVGTNTNGPPIGSAIYESHLTLPAGATKHLKTFVVEDQAPATVSARIVQNGRVVASGDSSGGSAATILIGVLSDQSTAMDSFSAVHPGSISATVVHLSLEDVGDSAVLLRAFDLLAIDDFATDSLTAAQRSALTDYVQNGGALLLGTGASWRKTLAGLPSSILPVNVDGTAVLNSVGALDNLSGLEVATGAVSAGSRVWVSEGTVPLMTERFVGSGLVTLAAFDWNRDPIASWTGSDALRRQVLVRTVYSSPAAQSVSFVKGGFAGTASATERSNALSQALGSLPALDLPSLVVIGLLVFAYVLLVGPINYFVLRAMNRRALAWITVPLIAVVASAGAFGAGLFTKGRSVEANQVSIVHIEPGWDRAYVESYTGLVTPTRGDYQVGVSGARPLVGPLSNYNGGPINSSPDLIRVSVDHNSILLPGMTAFVLRGFTAEGVVAAPNLVATASLVNGKLTGTVRNDSNVPITDAVVIAGDGYQLLKALAPGASATFDFAPKTTNPNAGPPAVSNIYTPYYGPQFGGPGFSGPSNPDPVAVEKTSILSLVASGSFSGFSPTITPMVVAWTNQEIEPVTVAGSRPHTTAETGIVLPLTVGQIGAGPLPPGMVVSRYTDIEGDSQPGPPGAVMTQNGTVTYDFTPAIAEGMHLTAASVDASALAQFGGLPGSTASAQADVWDWSASAWMPFTYVPQGITTLPQSAVNPTTSEVRLQFTANGTTVALGVMSLTGTVK